MRAAVLVCISATCFTLSTAQSFQKVTDLSNPIVSDIPTSGYTGASWVDYDGDGDIDLFVNQDFLYRNDGNGEFTRILDSGIEGATFEYNNGNTWGDCDNDGDMDLLLVNRNKNGLFRNQGDGTFVRDSTGDIAMSINAWSPAWGDYDNDGWLDLVATHPCGFTGACHANWLFHNNGDGTFTSITDSPISTGFSAYTSANWSDFDLDGDMDLFIGSGQINNTSLDHIYINQLRETGEATFTRKTTGSLFGDLRDGQNWNWIDYDNDGDLDGFVTNWKDDVPCDFYRNDGNLEFHKLTEDDLGVPMTSQNGNWLANVWGDFNNDGWIDVILGADNTGSNRCYRNNGDGTFSFIVTPFTNQRTSRGITLGDYDDDGDLDVYINASSLASKGLYENMNDEGNFILINLEGTISNHSAIGARVRVKATIDGNAFWQTREVSAQNSFCSHNSQRVHFGLGDATTIDSLVIHWPLGLEETYTDQPLNSILSFEEGKSSALFGPESLIRLSAWPNPAVSSVRVDFSVEYNFTNVKVFNAQGRQIEALSIPSGVDSINIPLTAMPAGTYFVCLSGDSGTQGVARLIRVE